MSELDTQELQYSMDLSSSSEDDSSKELSDFSSDESLPDITKLKPYDHEPACLPRSEDDLEDISRDDKQTKNTSRIGNTDWCLCGNCKSMETYSESLCCLDTNEVPEELFEGIFKHSNKYILQ